MKEIKLLLIGIAFLLYYSCIQEEPTLFKKSKVQRLVDGKVSNTILEINEELFNKIFSEAKTEQILEVPFEDMRLKLHLSFIENDYSINASNFDFTNGVLVRPLTYEGFIVDDQDSSFVSMTLTKDQLFGFIASNKYGTFTLEKRSSKDYLISKSISETQDSNIIFTCGTMDTLKSVELNPPNNRDIQKQVIPKCITIDYEVSHKDYLRLGTVQSCVNWVNQMFASVRALYSKEGWSISIKSIYVHTSPDGYSLQTDIALEQLKEKRKNDPLFKGTFLQLIQSVNGGAMGGIAYVGALCSEEYNVSVAQVLPNSGSAYPSYSWNINVMSHELGHNLGSPHTHSCVWPGGPIDNCYRPEGSCSPGPVPVNGGTVMSYCHLVQSIGMNMSNGFGEKPHALIEGKIIAASCLSCSVVIDTVKPVPPSSGYGLISLNKPANQSTTYVGGFAYPYKGEQPVQSFPANLANDNSKATFSRTDRELIPRLSIDLQKACNVKRVVIVPRVDCCYNLANFNLTIDNSLAFTRNGSLIRDSIAIDLDMKGRIISLNANQSWYNAVTGTYLQISDFKIYGFCGTVVNPPPCISKDTTYKVWRLVDSIGKICR